MYYMLQLHMVEQWRVGGAVSRVLYIYDVDKDCSMCCCSNLQRSFTAVLAADEAPHGQR